MRARELLGPSTLFFARARETSSTLSCVGVFANKRFAHLVGQAKVASAFPGPHHALKILLAAELEAELLACLFARTVVGRKSGPRSRVTAAAGSEFFSLPHQDNCASNEENRTTNACCCRNSVSLPLYSVPTTGAPTLGRIHPTTSGAGIWAGRSSRWRGTCRVGSPGRCPRPTHVEAAAVSYYASLPVISGTRTSLRRIDIVSTGKKWRVASTCLPIHTFASICAISITFS